MKIKLRTLHSQFKGITGVYDSIFKFSRVVDLSEGYKEIKNMVELFEEKRKSLTPPMDDEGKMSVKDYTAFENKLNDMLDEEITLKKPLKFTTEEAKAALESRNITSSQFIALEELFIVKTQPAEEK